MVFGVVVAALLFVAVAFGEGDGGGGYYKPQTCKVCFEGDGGGGY